VRRSGVAGSMHVRQRAPGAHLPYSMSYIQPLLTCDKRTSTSNITFCKNLGGADCEGSVRYLHLHLSD
jgi:hypothetical protein